VNDNIDTRFPCLLWMICVGWSVSVLLSCMSVSVSLSGSQLVSVRGCGCGRKLGRGCAQNDAGRQKEGACKTQGEDERIMSVTMNA